MPAAAATSCWGFPAATAAERALYQSRRAMSRVPVAAASLSSGVGGCGAQPLLYSASQRRSSVR